MTLLSSLMVTGKKRFCIRCTFVVGTVAYNCLVGSPSSWLAVQQRLLLTILNEKCIICILF